AALPCLYSAPGIPAGSVRRAHHLLLAVPDEAAATRSLTENLMTEYFDTINHAAPRAQRYAPPSAERDLSQNVHGTERILSAAGGALLIAMGLRRRGV